jgi:serine/threonine-protein kinase RsbW
MSIRLLPSEEQASAVAQGNHTVMNENHGPEVSITIPNAASHLRLVRLVVASIASDLGFDYNEVEDLRIVADEVVNLAMDNMSPDGPIRVDIFTGGPELRLRTSGPSRDSAQEPKLDVLASEIVRSLTASFEVLSFDGLVEATFCSHLPKLRVPLSENG